MRNGFKTVQGSIVITGLMGLPLWLWLYTHVPHTFPLCHFSIGIALGVGRLLSALVEVWVVTKYLKMLLE